jgi:hypothetical protein
MQGAFLTIAVMLLACNHASASEMFLTLKAPQDGARFVQVKPGDDARSVMTEGRGRLPSMAGGGASDLQSPSTGDRPSSGLSVTRQRIDFSAGREDRVISFDRR